MREFEKAILGLSILFLAIGAVGVVPQSAVAASDGMKPRAAYGVRTGLGLDPDQWVIGAQSVLGQSLGLVRFAPSFDLGFGNSVTTYVLNLDFVIDGDLPGSRSQLYGGAGGALVGWSRSGGNSDLEAGLNLLGGVRLPTKGTSQYNVEARFGFSDAPDVRLLVGILFGGGSPAYSQ